MQITERISENIADLYQDLNDKQNRRAIFKHYRAIDDSNLWPVCNNFNATERAIKRLYKLEREGDYYLLGLELCYFIDTEVGIIVNSI